MVQSDETEKITTGFVTYPTKSADQIGVLSVCVCTLSNLLSSAAHDGAASRLVYLRTRARGSCHASEFVMEVGDNPTAFGMAHK